MLKGQFYLHVSAKNYWDVQNFLSADRLYLGGKNTIEPTAEIGLMLITFETRGDIHPAEVPVGSWTAPETQDAHRRDLTQFVAHNWEDPR